MRSAVLMHRLRALAIAVLAVLLAAQLTLHNHSLIPEAGSSSPPPCAVCAFGADPASVAAPLPAFSLVLVFVLTAREERAFASAANLTLPSRGPPRA